MKARFRIMVVSGAVAIAAAWVSANASSGRELLFSAPIQKLDQGTETVTVLGQSFHAQTAQLSIGEIVRVYGVLQKDGSLSDALVEGTSTFGANGDAVFLKGVVTNSNPALGRIEIDGLTVDYTSQLGNSQFAIPSSGDVIALSRAAAYGTKGCSWQVRLEVLLMLFKQAQQPVLLLCVPSCKW